MLRVKEPKSAVLVFSSGNLVCTGTKSVAQVKEVIEQVIKEKGVNMYSVVGKFTIKGVEREIGLFTHIAKEGDKYIVESDFAIDRTLWNIRYGSSKFFDDLGDNLIDDTIEFKLKMSLDKEVENQQTNN